MKNYMWGILTGSVALLLALAASEFRRQVREQTVTLED